MKHYKKTILTLALLLTAATGAWADESETITTATKGTTVYTGTHFKITASYICDGNGIYLFSNNNHGTATIESLNGENITKIEMHMTCGGGKATKTTTTAGQLVATNSISIDSENDISVINVNATSVEIGTTVEASDGTEVKIDKYVIYYGPAPTPVDLTRGTGEKINEWTLTNGMPAGNVTLEPEYYPQAALTEAPTAINDVPATTDGAIVKAGTVENIGLTETAQGTVMYYVSPTALDDDALLALAADKWTADVPTAESLAQGQAYVYYYVRGNDSDTDDENFSDGDILAANALTVTIAAEPTYAVTFADGTPETDKWTASPNTGVSKGQTVTVTYSGERKVKSVKAVKKPAPKTLAEATSEDIGKIVGKDGKIYATKADAEAVATENAVAMIAYVGTESDCAHGLAIALADESGKKDYEPAGTACSGKVAVTGGTWRLPSEKDWQYMFIGCGSSEAYSAPTSHMTKSCSGLASKLTTAQGVALQTDDYWSSTDAPNDYVWEVKFGDSHAVFYDVYKGLVHEYRVRACLAF